MALRHSLAISACGVRNAQDNELDALCRRIQRHICSLHDTARGLSVLQGVGFVECFNLHVRPQTGRLMFDTFLSKHSLCTTDLSFLSWVALKMGLQEDKVKRAFEEYCMQRFQEKLDSDQPFMTARPETDHAVSDWSNDEAGTRLHGVAFMRWQHENKSKVGTLRGTASLARYRDSQRQRQQQEGEPGEAPEQADRPGGPQEPSTPAVESVGPDEVVHNQAGSGDQIAHATTLLPQAAAFVGEAESGAIIDEGIPQSGHEHSHWTGNEPAPKRRRRRAPLLPLTASGQTIRTRAQSRQAVESR